MTAHIDFLHTECNLLLQSCIPTAASCARRKEIHEYVADIIRKSLPYGILFGVGSSSLSTYLPESDIDLVLILNQHTGPSSTERFRNSFGKVFEALCEEIVSSDNDPSSNKTMTIRNIGLVNGRTKVVQCIVNNVGVDITVNQVGSLATVAFLEEADRCLGRDHILKKSVILIKVILKCTIILNSSRQEKKTPNLCDIFNNSAFCTSQSKAVLLGSLMKRIYLCRSSFHMQHHS